ncbi:MAG TPA: hypothetical protein VFS17_05690 [Methylophilaceae bacterium]|nr:hypothetical protein [Methylophilaceae bacterium]
MKIRLNHPDKDKDGSLDMPSLDPSRKHKYPEEDDADLQAVEDFPSDPDNDVADFPADVGNDLGQYTEDEGHSYPPFPRVTREAGGADASNAAQHGGSGPRVDDLGTDDLQDQPNDNGLEAVNAFMEDRDGIPVFDRSIENIDVNEPETDVEAGTEDTRQGRDQRLPEKEDQLAEEESEVYDESIDGPGTRDLH